MGSAAVDAAGPAAPPHAPLAPHTHHLAELLATVRRADRIIVLQDGRVIETGSHAALIATGGLYAQLYALNYASFDDIPDALISEALTGRPT